MKYNTDEMEFIDVGELRGWTPESTSKMYLGFALFGLTAALAGLILIALH